jgi:Holliday junction resolvase-like predicted endonuclease
MVILQINPEVMKSSRHSKITGNFAENLILYWLSKHGFESALVDHVGIDIIARNPSNNEVMGISVKMRSRKTGEKKAYQGIPLEHLEKVDFACKAFNCIPYLAFVSDEDNGIDVFILSKNKLLSLYEPTQTRVYFRYGEKYKDLVSDKEIVHIRFGYETKNWFGE